MDVNELRRIADTLEAIQTLYKAHIRLTVKSARLSLNQTVSPADQVNHMDLLAGINAVLAELEEAAS